MKIDIEVPARDADGLPISVPSSEDVAACLAQLRFMAMACERVLGLQSCREREFITGMQLGIEHAISELVGGSE